MSSASSHFGASNPDGVSRLVTQLPRLQTAHLPARPGEVRPHERELSLRLAVDNCIKVIERLSYPQFRTLSALLSDARNKDINLAPALATERTFQGNDPLDRFSRDGLAAVKDALTNIRKHLPATYEREAFAADAQLLVRRAAGVGGINIVNPDDMGAFTPYRHLEIRAENANHGVILRVLHDGNLGMRLTGYEGNREIIISPNHPAIIGRGTSTPRPFDVNVSLTGQLTLGPVITSDSAWSRGGLLVGALKDGGIVLLDRGSLNGYEVKLFDNQRGSSLRLAATLKYTPTISKRDDGDMTVGKSEFI